MNLELQFLAQQKQLYKELGDDFNSSSNSHALKYRTALENFSLLSELNIKVLIGAEVEWSVPGKDRQSTRKGPASASRSSPKKRAFSAVPHEESTCLT